MSSRRQTAVLVLLVALLALPSLPTRELMPTDEPRFALVARQMMNDPAPIVPHLGYDALTKQGEVYADKPPVFFWLISFFSFFTGGVNETSARLPSFFAAIAAVLLTRKIGSLLVNEITGFMAGLVLATMSQFFQRAFWCSIDMVLTAFVLAATYCWLRAVRSGPAFRTTLGLSTLGGLFAAAATLSKGPVGLIFPLAYLAGDYVANRFEGRGFHPQKPGLSSGGGESNALTNRGKEQAARAVPAIGVVPGTQVAPVTSVPATEVVPGTQVASINRAVPGSRIVLAALLAAAAAFFLPVAVWMVAAYIVGGPTYLVEILFKQNVTRYVAAWNNIAPWYYYIFRVPLGLFPSTLMLPAGILMAWARPRESTTGLRGLLLACGALFLFFSASTGKRGVYLLPLYPALAIVIAAAWRRLSFQPEDREPPRTVPRGLSDAAGGESPSRDSRPITVIAWVHAIVLCLAGLATLIILPLVARQRAPDLLLQILVLGVLMAATGILVIFFMIRRRPWASFITLVSGVALMTLAGSYLLVPGINRRAGVKAFGLQLAAVLLPDDFLVVDAEGYEQILFYSGARGTRRDFNETRVDLAQDGSVILQSRSARSPRGRAEPDRSETLSWDVQALGKWRAVGDGAHTKRLAAWGRLAPIEQTSLALHMTIAKQMSIRETSIPEAERARRRVQFPAGARVVFVVKGPNVDRVRSALGPSSRVLLAATLYENPYYVVANHANQEHSGDPKALAH